MNLCGLRNLVLVAVTSTASTLIVSGRGTVFFIVADHKFSRVAVVELSRIPQENDGGLAVGHLDYGLFQRHWRRLSRDLIDTRDTIRRGT